MKMKKLKINESKSSQTRQTFSEKWSRNPEIAIKQTLDENSNFQQWILERNGFKDADDAAGRLKNCSRILDAGCGNGRVTALLAQLAPDANIVGIDIIDMSIPKKNNKQFKNVDLFSADLEKDLSHLGKFDFIYCQEVLHHTTDARLSFHNLINILESEGKIAIYVYRKKAPAREFMDDYMRNQISHLEYKEAMDVCRQITELGKKLADLNVEIEIDDMPFMGIARGKYQIQRLIYHFFMKCYWNPDLSDEENAVINYDWYYPQICSRHTMNEVLKWFHDEHLQITWKFEDMYGITVHGVKE